MGFPRALKHGSSPLGGQPSCPKRAVGQLLTNPMLACSGCDSYVQYCTSPKIMLFVQNHVEKRLVDPQYAVVVQETQVAKLVHEETDARPGCSYHFGQHFVRDLRRQKRLPFALRAETRQQQGAYGPAASPNELNSWSIRSSCTRTMWPSK